MPFARLTLNAELTIDQIDDLQRALTGLVAGDLTKKHELTSVLIEPVPSGSWSIGAERQNVAAHLEVTVTTGTNSIEQKRHFVDRAMALLRRILPDLHDATYIVIQEVPGTNWGYNGKTQADRAAAVS